MGIAPDEIALEGPRGAFLVIRHRRTDTEACFHRRCCAGCFMARLWELLAECLPIAGITAVTEPVKRGVWGELLRRPADVCAQTCRWVRSTC